MRETSESKSNKNLKRFLLTGTPHALEVMLGKEMATKILVERGTVTEETIVATTYAQPCEKANICLNANRKCGPILYEPDTMLTIPARRWMYCHGWKATLDLDFFKELGFHMLEHCPNCNTNLIEYLKRKQQNLTL